MKTIKQSLPSPAVPTGRLHPTGEQTTTTQNLSFCGTVRLVEPSREMLLVHQPKLDNEQIIHWQSQTRFLCHGAEVKPDALRQGQKISVQFSRDAGQKFAKGIDIVVEPLVTKSTSGQRRSLWPLRTRRKARR